MCQYEKHIYHINHPPWAKRWGRGDGSPWAKRYGLPTQIQYSRRDRKQLRSLRNNNHGDTLQSILHIHQQEVPDNAVIDSVPAEVDLIHWNNVLHSWRNCPGCHWKHQTHAARYPLKHVLFAPKVFDQWGFRKGCADIGHHIRDNVLRKIYVLDFATPDDILELHRVKRVGQILPAWFYFKMQVG